MKDRKVKDVNLRALYLMLKAVKMCTAPYVIEANLRFVANKCGFDLVPKGNPKQTIRLLNSL